MRLLFLTNVYPSPVWPGKGTFNASLVQALTEQDRVRVVCPVAWTDRIRVRGKLLPTEAVEVSRQLKVDYPTYYFTPRVLRSMYGEFMDWSIGGRVDRAIQEERPEAIVSYWAHPDGAVAVRHAQRAGIPALVMVGGSDVLLLAQAGSRRKKILNVLQEADRVIAVSGDIATKLQRDGIAGDKIRVIRRGVNREIFQSGSQEASRLRLGLPTTRKVIIAVGRLVNVKGFEQLIGACRQLRDRGEDLLCCILGDGELRTKLQGMIDQYRLGDRVFLSGNQQQMRLADWYRAADLTVLSSWSEGVPNVLLESMACGTCFVATDVGGVSEIADPEADRLVPPGDIPAIADGISAMLARGKFRGSRRYEPISWGESAGLLRKEIQSCLGKSEPCRQVIQDVVEVTA